MVGCGGRGGSDVRAEKRQEPFFFRRGIFHKWIVTSIRDAVSATWKRDPEPWVGGLKGGGEWCINAKWPWKGGKKTYNENTRGL